MNAIARVLPCCRMSMAMQASWALHSCMSGPGLSKRYAFIDAEQHLSMSRQEALSESSQGMIHLTKAYRLARSTVVVYRSVTRKSFCTPSALGQRTWSSRAFGGQALVSTR